MYNYNFKIAPIKGINRRYKFDNRITFSVSKPKFSLDVKYMCVLTLF